MEEEELPGVSKAKQSDLTIGNIKTLQNVNMHVDNTQKRSALLCMSQLRRLMEHFQFD